MRFRKPKHNGESHAAIQEAQTHVEEVKSRGEEVSEIAGALREIRRRNHFAEQVVLIMTRDIRGGI